VRRRLPMAIQRIQTDHGSEFGTCTAPGFLDTSGGCQGMAPATIVDPGATVRSRLVRAHGHAARAAARAPDGV
jgi:hypothetical protein